MLALAIIATLAVVEGLVYALASLMSEIGGRPVIDNFIDANTGILIALAIIGVFVGLIWLWVLAV